MDIEPLDIENAYRVTSEIPLSFIQSPGITFWIYVINQKELVQNSERQTIGVRTGGVLDITIELDSVPNQAQGTFYRPTAYVFNNNIPIVGAISLLIDNQTVYTSPAQVFDSDNPSVLLEWKIPKSKETFKVPYSPLVPTKQAPESQGILEILGRLITSFFDLFSGESKQVPIESSKPINGLNSTEAISAKSYQIGAQLHVYEKVVATTSTELNTFPSTISTTITEPVEAMVISDKSGNIVAIPVLLYSSFNDVPNIHYRLNLAQGGVCFIGQADECLIKESTTGNKANVVSKNVHDQIYRIRYLDADNPLQRFGISSIDSVVGTWNITLESLDGIKTPAIDIEDVTVKIKYKAKEEKLVTITSD